MGTSGDILPGVLPAKRKQRLKTHAADTVVVVTGASMGIGEAIAGKFTQEGAWVVLSARHAQTLESARLRIGSLERTIAFECDLRDSCSIEALVACAIERYGRIDVWINNAGYGLLDAIEYTNLHECRRMFDVNLFAAIECMQHVIPVMKRQKHGTIINISSGAGYVSIPYMAAYSASKHALIAIGNAARIELHETGIHVMTVCPGYVDTGFGRNALKGKTPINIRPDWWRGIDAQRVANATFAGYLKRRREIAVPWQDGVYVAVARMFPWLIEALMARTLDSVREARECASSRNEFDA
jgi:short-subunit dehydrogenase